MLLFFKYCAFLLLVSTSIQAQEPDINIQGLTELQLSNVRGFLSLTQEDCKTPRWRIKAAFAKTDEEVAKALSALGYYQSETIKQLSFTAECWEINIDISVGAPVRVSPFIVKVTGEAKNDENFLKVLSSLPIKQGDILNHALYEKIKQDLRSLALEQGYLDHQFSKKVLQINPKKQQARIELIMDSGPRHRFGNINIEQGILNPDFIARYLSIKSDEYYSSKKLAKTYNALAESIYFNSVEVKPLMAQIEEYKIPVDIVLTPKKKHDFSFGLGFDTDIGPLASFGYQNRRLNRKGHHFSFDMDISPILSNVESRYTIPFTEPKTDHLAFAAGYKYEKPDTFESQEAKLSLQYQHLYQNRWKQILFVDLSYEESTISTVNQNTLLLIFGAHWRFKESNNAIRPTQGYLLNFSLLSAPEKLISDVTFLQATAAAKLITPLPWSARFITRAKFGATLVDNFDGLPASYRFFAGGIETIRGYDYKELGPVDEQNNVIGGKMLSVVSAEYEHFINSSWGVAAFVDAGNAYNKDKLNIKTGAGIGLRWVSPIGAIRLDFALPLNDSNASFQIHFAAGTQL